MSIVSFRKGSREKGFIGTMFIEVVAIALVIITVATYYYASGVRSVAKGTVLPAGSVVAPVSTPTPTVADNRVDVDVAGNTIRTISYTPETDNSTAAPAYTLEYSDEYAGVGEWGWVVVSGEGATVRRTPANNALVAKLVSDVIGLQSEEVVPRSEVGDEYFLRDFMDDTPSGVQKVGRTPARLTITTRNGDTHTLQFGSAIREESSHFQGFMYVQYGGDVHIVTTTLYQIIPEYAEQVASLRVYNTTPDEMEFWAVNVGGLQYSMVFSHTPEKGGGGVSDGDERRGVWILNSQAVLLPEESRRIFEHLAPLDAFRVFSLGGKFPRGCAGAGFSTVDSGDAGGADSMGGSMVVYSPDTPASTGVELFMPICQVGLFYYIQNGAGYVYELDAYPFAALKGYD